MSVSIHQFIEQCISINKILDYTEESKINIYFIGYHYAKYSPLYAPITKKTPYSDVFFMLKEGSFQGFTGHL